MLNHSFQFQVESDELFVLKLKQEPNELVVSSSGSCSCLLRLIVMRLTISASVGVVPRGIVQKGYFVLCWRERFPLEGQR